MSSSRAQGLSGLLIFQKKNLKERSSHHPTMGLLNKVLRRCALCFAVVQMGKAAREVGVGKGVAVRLKRSLHAARRRINARKVGLALFKFVLHQSTSS